MDLQGTPISGARSLLCAMCPFKTLGGPLGMCMVLAGHNLGGCRFAGFAGPFVMGKLVSLPGGYSTAMIVMGSVNLFNAIALYCRFPPLTLLAP